MQKAHALLDGFNPKYVMADKAYDADSMLETIKDIGAEAVIPPKRNRIVQREYDKELYKERNQVERLFAKLKEFRRIATRYDKLLVNFLGFVKIAAIFLWLK